jgi:CDP-diacylglycerol pyrophosphatase
MPTSSIKLQQDGAPFWPKNPVILRNIITTLVCAGWLTATAAPPDSPRDRLRAIAEEQCLPHWVAEHDPAPCVSVTQVRKGPAADGFVVLADKKGGAHFLLIPTRTISGIESPEVRASGALNYFESAWEAREVLSAFVGHDVARTAVGMAVNQVRARSQDQLHIHISCLRRVVYDALQAQVGQIGESWSPLNIGDVRYQALRVMGQKLGKRNPFELLADRLPGAKGTMGDFTLLVAGMEFKQGAGFVLLAGNAVPGAELMLDSSCAVTDSN